MNYDKCIRDDTKTSDCIDRETVLYLLKEKWNMFSDANDAMQESIDSIRALPNVQPERAKGNWVPIDEEPHEDFECNRCGNVMCAVYDIDDYKFCPECGADMRGGE